MLITETHLYFYTKKPFNNWFCTPDQILMNGLRFDSSEQAWMFTKAAFFRDYDSAALIHLEKDPANAKALGRGVKGYDDNAWATVREGQMAYVNLLKYRQNEWMKNALLETGERILVEASPIDKIWGVGLAETDPLILDEKNWKGLNLLGKALMTVRTLLKQEVIAQQPIAL